jgi:hypothetical protein
VSDADCLVHDSAMHWVLAAWWLRSFAMRWRGWSAHLANIGLTAVGH